MKKYLYLLCFGTFVLAGCEKEPRWDTVEPYNYVMCDLEDEESYDGKHFHTLHVGRDGGECVLRIVEMEDELTSYFCRYYVVVGEPANYKYSESYSCRYGKKGLDSYSCRWFEISRISNHKFKVKINAASDEYDDKIRIEVGFCVDDYSYNDVGAHFFEIY